MRRRLVGLCMVFGLLMLLAVVKLTDLQVVSRTSYLDAGRSQRLVRVVLPASRGAILDRNGNDLAVSIPRPTVVADQTLVGNPSAVAATLAPVLGKDEGQLRAELTGKARFVYLARLVSDDVASRVKSLKDAKKLPGIDIIQEFQRFDPAGDVGRSVVGMTTIDGVGLSGIEKGFDAKMLGTPGSVSYERSRLGPIAGGKRQVDPSRPGDDVRLTIDRSLQFQTEQLLGAQVARTGSKGGIAIISRPDTGEILAMANMVTDPKTGQVHTSSNNSALTTVFEPGSVNKVITVSGSIEQGLANPATVLDTPPHLQLGGATFGEAEALPGRMSVTDVLTVSSNIGTIQLAKQLGKDRIDHYLRAFGFGSKTAVDFPNESAGLMLPLSQWSGSSIGSIPIGQGISVTPLQMLAAYNVIANDGTYVAPRLVQATIGTDGVEHELPEPAPHRVVSSQTARAVRGMLTNVVKYGTGQKAAVPGYLVAGKTGTARKPLDQHQPGDGYLGLDGAYHYVSTFVGMVPAGNPSLSIIVVLDEPDPAKSYYASDTAAPLFSDLARVTLRMFHIPPSTAGDPTVGLPPVSPALVANAAASESSVGPLAASPGTPPPTTVAPAGPPPGGAPPGPVAPTTVAANADPPAGSRPTTSGGR